MKLYLIAGEASGDARGAELMRSLQEQNSELQFFGAGGRQMCAIAGNHLQDWADEAVVGIWDVLKKYRYFKKQFNLMLHEIEEINPAAVILIDYPGFNLRLAKALKKRNPPLRIFYYISPQVWAWNRGRTHKISRMVDLMICIFPFEKTLYEKSGLKAVFVGHPMIDFLTYKKGAERDKLLVGLFPGSREREVRRIFPVMIEAAIELQKRDSKLRFEASAASESTMELMKQMILKSSLECTVGLRNSHDLMQQAMVGMVASGTATLEAAYFQLPFTLIYRVAWLTYVIGRLLIKVEYLGMPNILAGKELVREFLQEKAQPNEIANEITRLLNDAQARQTMSNEFGNVIAKLGLPGASHRAASTILNELKP